MRQKNEEMNNPRGKGKENLSSQVKEDNSLWV